MSRTKRVSRSVAPAAPVLPESILAPIADAGFTVHAYLDKAAPVQPRDYGSGLKPCSEWLPRLAIAPGTLPGSFKVLEWLPQGHPANAYGFDGWQTSDGHDCGGMYKTPLQALAWFSWIVQARKGNPFG